MLKKAITRLAKGSMIYGIGGMLQRFVGLLLLPFFTSVLSTEDYGVVALISLVSVAMSGLLTLGTSNSLGVLYYREQDHGRRHTIIWTNTIFMAVNGLMWYCVIYLCAPKLSALMFRTDIYADLIRLSLMGSVFSFLVDPFLAYLRMEEKAKLHVSITLICSLMNIGLSIWFVLFQRIGVLGIILAGAITHGVMIFVNWFVIGRKLRFKIEVSLFSPMVRIGFPSVFGIFAFLIIDYADRQMIERMVSLDGLGVYSVGYSFGMVMIVAMSAFATAWSPFFMSYIDNRKEARTVFARVLTYYLIGFGALIVLFFFFAKPALLIMTTSSFHEAFNLVGLVAASYMLKGCYLIFLPGVYFAEKLHLQTFVEWVAAITNICLNLWLISSLGILGAALATFFSYLILPILAWLVARPYLDVDYEWKRVFSILVSVLIASILLYWISIRIDGDLILTLGVNSFVLLGFLFVAHQLLLTASERDLLRGLLKP